MVLGRGWDGTGVVLGRGWDRAGAEMAGKITIERPLMKRREKKEQHFRQREESVQSVESGGTAPGI